MSLYARVNGSVVDVPPMPLPESWGPVGGLNRMNDTELAAVGWYPVVENKPAFDPATHKLGDPTHTFNDTLDIVESDFPVVALSHEEIVANHIPTSSKAASRRRIKRIQKTDPNAAIGEKVDFLYGTRT